MRATQPSRREFLSAAAAGALIPRLSAAPLNSTKPVVSIVKIQNGNIDYAVEHAIELLGGIRSLTQGKERVMLKPNLVAPTASATTKPAVVRSLARLMKGAHKHVSIGEGSAFAPPFNVQGSEVFRTTKKDLLNGLQQYVFDQLGYTELARSLRVPLINLHTGELVDVKVPGAFVFENLTLHRSLMETDLLCSVPMMKTHTLAGVTLGMKNLIGVYPGAVYQAVRGRMHDIASRIEPSGTAAAIVDMVRANKLGLVVVDGSSAMEGDGPADGTLVPMNLIVAGANPLATDMISAALMGFAPAAIPTFTWANKAGLRPERLEDIEVRGEPVESTRRRFARPRISPWSFVRNVWATREI
ncbi:MAG TPA: DUF362 domain-containing protein [Bryobacteraceae bacterium]|nr:DUF362 domain-containing protein [Bryobacteraceae bacterium]